MSEYQYYEFVAIDHPLTAAQMAELRSRSTRAAITPTSFVNVYHWGDLKADPSDWMRHYFDAFVYVANWGTCRFVLRLPRTTFASEVLSGFLTHNALTLEKSPDHWVIEWALNESEDDDRFGNEDGEGWMGRLVAVRDELLRDDYRALYLGWLAGVTAGEIDENALEPEVPPGLACLTVAQQSLAEFIEVDPDLLVAAAMESPPMDDSARNGYAEAEIQEWLETVPIHETHAILKLLLAGQSRPAERQIRMQFSAWQKARSPQTGQSKARRSVAELWKLAEVAREMRLKRAEEALAQLQAEQRRRREAHLAVLATDFDRYWNTVDMMAEQGIASAYEKATQALLDLSEAYVRHSSRAEFDARFRSFAERHGKRQALVRRLKGAGLWY